MSYPTMPPWCPPQGMGSRMTFPPVCPPAQPVAPQQFGARAPQAPPRGGGGVPWTATGTVVEPRCFFQTQSGDTCPVHRCEWLNSIFVDCPPRGTMFHQPPCVQIPEPNTQTSKTCPPGVCSIVANCAPPRQFAVGAAAPTPTATFPPVCYPQPQPQPQPQPAMQMPMPTVYPNYTCGFVCNTQFCAPQPFAPAPQQQFGAQFQGTLVSPRCLRTIDIVVCQPTTRGDTCPPTLCTIWGIGCPPPPVRPWQQQQQPQQVGAFTVTITMTVIQPRCQPTTRGDTCPPTICSIFGVGCPQQPPPLPWPQWPQWPQVAAALPPAAWQTAGVTFDCGPTMMQGTCLERQCFPTIGENTCPQWCGPTVSGETCPPESCSTTMFCPPAGWGPQAQAGNVPGTPTIVGQTCPFFICQPTFNFCPPPR